MHHRMKLDRRRQVQLSSHRRDDLSDGVGASPFGQQLRREVCRSGKVISLQVDLHSSFQDERPSMLVGLLCHSRVVFGQSS